MRHTILKLDMLEGKTNVNLDELSKLLLDNYDKRMSLNPIDTSYEDSYCPPSSLIDQVSKEMVYFFRKYTGLDIHANGEYWGHIHEKNMSTNIHNHIGSDVSSVLYVSVPEGSGEIVFIPGMNHLKSFPPKEGTFYMFPSFVEHYVTRNKSDKKRISLSVNFNKGISNE